MHHSRFEKAGLIGAALFLCTLLLPLDISAQSEDSVAVDDEPRSKHSVSIKIDEHGIRIEGAKEPPADSIGRASRPVEEGTTGVRRYRELGTDIVRFGEDIYVEYDDLVRGDIVVFGGDVSVKGKVIGNIVVMAGDAEIRSGAEVDGDVVVLGGMLIEEPGVIVHGERVEFNDISIGFPHLFAGRRPLVSFFCVPITFFICVILSFLVILFLRDRILRSQEHAAAGVLKCFGTGFLVLFVGSIVVPIVCCILIITIIGSPLAGMLIVSCVAVWIMSRTVAAYAVGVKVSQKINLQTQNPFAIVLVGTSILFIPALLGVGISLWPLGSAPGFLFIMAGLLIGLFADLVGLGAIFVSRFGSRGFATLPAPTASGTATPTSPKPGA
jgi:hypothetical protein